MSITQRKILFFSLSALFSGIISIILRTSPYIDLFADIVEFLYIIFIFSSISCILSNSTTIFRALLPIIMVLATSPHCIRYVYHYCTTKNITPSSFLTYACFSFMVMAPIVEILTNRNKAKLITIQTYVHTKCKNCNHSMLYEDVFCPKCNTLSADVISFLQKHPTLHHLDFTLDNRHDYLHCPFCGVSYGSTRYTSTHNALASPIYRCECGAYLINHNYTEWSVVPLSRKIRYCVQGGYFALVSSILIFFVILSLPDAEYTFCAITALLYAIVLRVLWLGWITVLDIQDSYKRLYKNPYYPQILEHMAYEHLASLYRNSP